MNTAVGPSRRPPGRPRGARPSLSERRDQILDAAELAIGRHGAGVSMEEIAEAAGVSKATIYDNFDGKAGMTRELVNRYGAQLLGAFVVGLGDALPPEQLVRRGLSIFLDHIEANPGIYQFVIQNPIDQHFLDPIAGPLAELLRTLFIRQGDDPAPAQPLAYASLGGLVAATDSWSVHHHPPKAVFHAALTDFVWGGLVAAGVTPTDTPIDLQAVYVALRTPVSP